MDALRAEGSLTSQDEAYLEALRKNILNRCRDIVTTCRASSQRLDDFEDSISDANKSSLWGQDAFGDPITVSPARQLLRDMVIRWSSKFLMVDRVLELLPVRKYSCICEFLLRKPQAIDIFFDKHPALRDLHALSTTEVNVLDDIRTFLNIPHAVQEMLSAEHTPTICHVIPAYEKMLILLERASIKLPLLAHAINASIDKIIEYLGLSRYSRTYGMAIGRCLISQSQRKPRADTHNSALNPVFKFKWLHDHWSSEDIKTVRFHVRSAVSHCPKSIF